MTIVASDVAPIGGMERVIHALAVRLLERGWELTIIARRCDIEPQPGLRHVVLRRPDRPRTANAIADFVHGAWAVRRHGRGLVTRTTPYPEPGRRHHRALLRARFRAHSVVTREPGDARLPAQLLDRGPAGPRLRALVLPAGPGSPGGGRRHGASTEIRETFPRRGRVIPSPMASTTPRSLRRRTAARPTVDGSACHPRLRSRFSWAATGRERDCARRSTASRPPRVESRRRRRRRPDGVRGASPARGRGGARAIRRQADRSAPRLLGGGRARAPERL